MVHIVGVGLLIGNLVLVDLRVWGFSRTLSVQALAPLALGLVAAGFGLAAASGLLMFAAQAQELLANRAFVLKTGLMLLAALNALWFHLRRSLERLDRTARGLTLLSTGLWLAVIICGRSIAYV